MFSRSLLLIAAACLASALASCGSGSAGPPGSRSGASPGPEAVAWTRAVSSVQTARSRADESMDAAVAEPSATAIKTASVAISAYVEAAEAAASTAENLQSADGSDRRASAQSALRTAQAYKAANERRLNDLKAAPSGSGSNGSVDLQVQRQLTALRARPLTHLELGYEYRNYRSSIYISKAQPCSESDGTCVVDGSSLSAKQYFSPTFFSSSHTTSPFADRINGVDAFSQGDEFADPFSSELEQYRKLLALGKYSVARMDINRSFVGASLDQLSHFGAALGERHSGRPEGSSGSAAWRGRMVGVAMDSGSLLAGESALTYSFAANTVDVEISDIRAIDDVAAYTGGKSFAWSGLSVNSDGSFYIPGYNNERSVSDLNSALHPTLGYIDGDFYGPNAEEAAGIFTRDNVNGAWVANCVGPCDAQAPPSENPDPPPARGPLTDGSADSVVRRELSDLNSRSLTHIERGYTYGFGGALAEVGVSGEPCSESSGTCIFPARSGERAGESYHAEEYLNSLLAIFNSERGAPFAADPVNGVETFSRGLEFSIATQLRQEWDLLALGEYSAAHSRTVRLMVNEGLQQATVFGAAFGERHSGRPNEPSGSAAWRGRMVGVAMDSGSLLAGESALTYSFAANTVDVEISDIRAIDDVAAYTGGKSFAWSGLSVNSDGSFYIPGYNNERSVSDLNSALHPTLGYIDGDFYGPNAEEAAGIFTRDNVNGAWMARK